MLYTVKRTPLLVILRSPAAHPSPLRAPPRSSTMMLKPVPLCPTTPPRGRIAPGGSALNFKGSVVELSKLAGEPVDIYVNQRKLAQGEVVVVDENFAIRITTLAEQSERLKSLG